MVVLEVEQTEKVGLVARTILILILFFFFFTVFQLDYMKHKKSGSIIQDFWLSCLKMETLALTQRNHRLWCATSAILRTCSPLGTGLAPSN